MKRLKKMAYFESLYYDMEQNYDEVDKYLETIESILDTLNSDMTPDDLQSSLANMENTYDDIHYNIDMNKGYGQDNENTLYTGRDTIEELTNQRDELADQLSELENEIDDMKYNIEHFANKKRLFHKLAVRKFICTTHDEIMEACEDAKRICSDYYDSLNYDELEVTQKVIDDITNKLFECNSDIKSGIDEARESNNDMNRGIDADNTAVDKLEDEISNLNDEIEEKTSEFEDLKDQLEELEESKNE